MKTFVKLAAVLALGLCGGASAAFAQDGADEAAVWTAVERQWRAEQRRDKNWTDEMLAADFVGWPNESPAPRNRTSTRLWSDFNSRQSDTLEYELYPMSIVVHGDMAVAHYVYTIATKRKNDEASIRNGRYSDVLVRIDGGWKFIAWHGGDDAG